MRPDQFLGQGVKPGQKQRDVPVTPDMILDLIHEARCEFVILRLQGVLDRTFQVAILFQPQRSPLVQLAQPVGVRLL